MIGPIVQAAEELADSLLFPTALETDAAPLVPKSHLDALAEAGLFALSGPPELGGVDTPTLCSVIEALAGGCLATTFVWIQHNTPVRSITASANEALRARWLEPLCRGDRRAGIAFGGLRAGRAQVTARRVDGGWLLNGDLPFVTGWGVVDLLMVAARTEDDQRVISALLAAQPSQMAGAEPLRLIAANSTGTVRLSLRDCYVSDTDVISDAPYRRPPDYDGGGRHNGSLSLGVAGRCLRLIGPSPLDAELDAWRRALDEAPDTTMAAARAGASAFALRAAGALIVARGSRSIFLEDQAQRLYREAAFLLVFGSRNAIRDSLLRRFGVVNDPS
ncbi:MAG TPA: acyl-CoA dehydrogenase family protein [Dehalococcoidia bacterium]|nr:acyl-CoA dehydrogenase family protein [Dehalococcoidia bacterium]